MKKLVIGCGFLGLPLAKCWSAEGHEVYATTRSIERAAEFESLNLSTIVLDTTDSESTKQLHNLHFDAVVIAVGMDRSRYTDIHHVYVNGLKNVLDCLSDTTSQVIYVSSTGVFGDFDGEWVDESSPAVPTRDGGKACLAAETLLRQSRFANQSVILRMAGLYGNERVPGKAAIKAKSWSRVNPNGYLNLVHVGDAVRAIQLSAEQQITNELFLISDSNPPTRKEYYQYLADLLKAGSIPWSEIAESTATRNSKRITSRKFQSQTGFKLKHPDYRSGLQACEL